MKTETEKAIEFCGNVMYQEDVCDCEEDDLLYNEEMRKVIALLQQGEKYKKEYVKREAELYLIIKKTRKYKQMWNLNKKEAFQNSKEGETIHPTRILLDLEYLEQRYFPKELPDEKTTKL